MHGDAYYRIGGAHTYCQDYARAATRSDGRWVAALSDGCSSSPRTDLGARALVSYVFGRTQLPLWTPGATATQVGNQLLRSLSVLMGRPPVVEAPWEGDATLLTVTPSETGDYLNFSAFGDGVFVLWSPNGLAWWSIEFSDGAPGYPSYALSTERLRAFLDASGGCRSVIARDGLTQTIWVDDGDGLLLRRMLPKDGALVAAVLSDGVRSFRRGREVVQMGDVIRRLCDFKTFAGAFVERRCRGFFRSCAELGWEHDDDFSMAALYLGEEP